MSNVQYREELISIPHVTMRSLRVRMSVCLCQEGWHQIAQCVVGPNENLVF